MAVRLLSMRMAMAKLMKISGLRLLLIKLQGVLDWTVMMVRMHHMRTSSDPCILLMPVGDGTSIPFNTQFFHDDDGDVSIFDDGFNDGFNGDLAGTADPGEQDLLADMQVRTRHVRSTYQACETRDVRKLSSFQHPR